MLRRHLRWFVLVRELGFAVVQMTEEGSWCSSLHSVSALALRDLSAARRGEKGSRVERRGILRISWNIDFRRGPARNECGGCNCWHMLCLAVA
ncbi:hypothetical protein MES5069_180118 [Mesorhizobium escarrei]|uniref:Secreted protein n=1 Tax=Mesorhizobium escarrei TaxID=666018 RepID=A0ABM9DMK7_9HYPH|nr:hypothetical protein MES5069_180118 [Mesorhizobium escarrei]